MRFLYSIISLLFISCSTQTNPISKINCYLEALNNLETIRYTYALNASPAYDTSSYIVKDTLICEASINELDTVIGAKIRIFHNKTQKIATCYDYDYDIHFNWEDSTAEIRDCNKYPEFRNPLVPINIKTKALLEYSFKSDKAEIMSFPINTKISALDITFKGIEISFSNIKADVIKEGDSLKSRFIVWFDNYNNLPVKYISCQRWQKYEEEVLGMKINKVFKKNIDALGSIPTYFTIQEYYPGKKRNDFAQLIDKQAPNINLVNVEGDSINLANYVGKVVLIQFTSVGCGPCHESIPFLMNLKKSFSTDIFELLSIESYRFNDEVLLKYKRKHNLIYQFLIGNRDITSEYLLPGVPTFYLIDKNGLIQKVIVGFQKDITENEIRGSINDLI